MLSSSSRDTHWHTSLALRCLRAEHSEFLIDSLPFRSTGSLGSTCCQRTPMQARLRACSLLDIFFVLHSLISKHASALKPGVYLFNEASHWNNNSFHCIFVFVEERESSLCKARNSPHCQNLMGFCVGSHCIFVLLSMPKGGFLTLNLCCSHSRM